MCQFKQQWEIETDFIPTRIRNKIWQSSPNRHCKNSPTRHCRMRFFRWNDKLILNFVCLVWNAAISLAAYRFYPRKRFTHQSTVN
jgi:hypothetical protein